MSKKKAKNRRNNPYSNNRTVNKKTNPAKNTTTSEVSISADTTPQTDVSISADTTAPTNSQVDVVDIDSSHHVTENSKEFSTPVQKEANASTESRSENNLNVRKVFVFFLSAILVVVFAIFLCSPIQRASRKFASTLKKSVSSNPLIPIRYDDGTMSLATSISIGNIVETQPYWITRGLEDVQNGSTNNEMAILAARYETEKFFIESRYNALDCIGGRSFDAKYEWQTAVFTLGSAYFEHPDDYDEADLQEIRNSLLYLLL